MHGSKQKKECALCKALISLPNFNKHTKVCGGRGTQAMKDAALKEEVATRKNVCSNCNKEFSTIQALNGHTQRSHTDKDKQREYGILGAGLGGNKKGEFHHSDETKNNLSIIASKRIAKHSKYSKNIEYKPGIILESSFEVRTAEILDLLNVEWIKVRKGYVWNDCGKQRRYIPDFYLPNYDLFLDPKNDYLIKKDKVKIDSAMQLNGIKVVVLSDAQINKEFIQTLVP